MPRGRGRRSVPGGGARAGAAGLAAAAALAVAAWGTCWVAGEGRRRLRSAAVARAAAERSARPWVGAPDDVEGEAAVWPWQPPQRLLHASFEPGQLGMDVVWCTGEVAEVHAGGQAEHAGVQAGWYFETVDGQVYAEELLDDCVAGRRPYAVTFKEGWRAGPAELLTMPGKRAHHLLWQRPADFAVGLEEEFTQLRQQAEADKAGIAAPAPLAALEGAAVMQERVREVRRRDLRRAAAELLYLSACAGLWRVGAAPAAPLEAGSFARLGMTLSETSLTSAVHSPLALAAVEEHLVRSLASTPVRPGSVLQVLLFNIGQAYAMSLLFGHVLRRAEERWSLERQMDGECGAMGTEGAGRALQRYITEKIGPGTFQDMMTSREAHLAADMQVRALFGDLRSLRLELVQHLGIESQRHVGQHERRRVSEKLEEAVERGEVAVLRLDSRELRRLLLEAVAFGSLLRAAEVQAVTTYDLTPTETPELDRFGIDTDENGCPVLPKE